MTLRELIDHLNTAHGVVDEEHEVLATTPHGTYTFDIDDIELGLSTGTVLLRLLPLDEDDE